MPSLKIGVRTTTVLAHLFASLSESDTLGSAPLTGTLIPLLWKSAIFWNVSTRDGVHWNSSLWTGFYCLSSRGYLFQGRSVVPFSEPGL